MDSQESGTAPIVIEEANTRGWPHKKQNEGIEHSIHSSRGQMNARQGAQYNEERQNRGNKPGGFEHLIHSPKAIPAQGWTTTTTMSAQLPESIRGSYTQILVNPMQLQDHEFTAWLDRLVEARKNRQEKKSRPYRNYRKPYNEEKQSQDSRWQKPQLRHKMKLAQELDVQQIMETYQCQYDDVIETVDLYNLDVEECRSA